MHHRNERRAHGECVLLWACNAVFPPVLALHHPCTTLDTQTLFGSLACLFFFLIGGLYNSTCKKFAGWFGFWVAAVAFYAAAAELVNTTYNRQLLPMLTRRVKQHTEGTSPDMLTLPGEGPYKYDRDAAADVEGGNRTQVVP